MKYLKENWSSLLTIVFLLVVGVLLLINPSVHSIIVLRIAGGLVALLGIYDLIMYFKAPPAEAAKGSGFYSGVIMITVGMYCLLRGDQLMDTFPMAVVLYGLFQIVLGYRHLQKMVDDLRMHDGLWWTRAISAGLSLLFGYLIALNPEMSWINIWIFTGIAMILEGAFDAVAFVIRMKRAKTLEAAAAA